MLKFLITITRWRIQGMDFVMKDVREGTWRGESKS
jgi:hypothetical protein